MTYETNPISADSMDDMPFEYVQTGFEPIKIYTNRWLYTSDDYYACAMSSAFNPKVEKAWSGTADEDTVLAEDIELPEYVCRGLLGQATKWLNDRAYSGSWTDITDAANYKLLYFWYYNFSQTLNRLEPRKLQDDGSTAATTLAQIIQGLDWNDEGVGGGARHHQWVKRWADFMGYRYSKIRPNFVDKLDAANETNRTRVSMILAAFAAIEFCYVLPALVLQSERAMFALAAMHEGELNKKIQDVEGLGGAFEDIWRRLTTRNRYDTVTGNFTNYVPMTTRFINLDVLDASDVDTTLSRARNNFRMPTFAVNFGKTFAGISKYTDGQRTIHFANLHTFHPADDDAYPLDETYVHGSGEWLLGQDLAVCLDWLSYNDGWIEDMCHVIVKDRKHYTWTGDELSKIVDDMWVDFNFITTISGYCSPVIQRGLDRHFAFDSNTKTTLTDSKGKVVTVYPDSEMKATFDPESLIDTLMWEDDNNVFSHWWWLSLYGWDYDDPKVNLVSYGGMTPEEIAADFLLGMLIDTNKPNADRDHAVELTKIVAVELVDAENYDKLYGFASTKTGTSMPRFEDIYDHLSAYASFGHRDHIGAIASANLTKARMFTEPRLKGHLGFKPKIIKDWGKYQTKLAMIDLMWSLLGSNSPIKEKAEEKPKTEIKPKASQPKDEPKDETKSETPSVKGVGAAPNPKKPPSPEEEEPE
jgi:hypothetical protein